jgi:hypothetical protein
MIGLASSDFEARKIRGSIYHFLSMVPSIHIHIHIHT